jgi:fibronectin type 3 domain-containing protein
MMKNGLIKNTRRFLSLLIALTMVIAILPSQVLSDELPLEEPFSSTEETAQPQSDSETTESNTETTDTDANSTDTDANSTDSGESLPDSDEQPQIPDSESVPDPIRQLVISQILATDNTVTLSFSGDCPEALFYQLILDDNVVSEFNVPIDQTIYNLNPAKKYAIMLKAFDNDNNVVGESSLTDVYTSLTVKDIGYTLPEDTTVYSFSSSSDYITDLNGFKLTVLNDLNLSYGTININGGYLYIKGNFNYQQQQSNYGSYGHLQMQNENDYVLVDGNFNISNYYNQESSMSAGTLEVKGDFTQKINIYDTNGSYMFAPSGTHKTILSGTRKQSVVLGNPYSRFNILEIKNASSEGVVFGSDVNYNELVANGNKVSYEQGVINTPSDRVLQKDEIIRGKMTIQNETIDLNGYSMTIEGDLVQEGGILKINGGTLNISGDYLIQNDQSSGGSQCSALLVMTNSSDCITVGGDFVTYSTDSHENYMTAGTLEVKGDIRQKYANEKNIYSTGSHTIILSGDGDQIIDLRRESRVNNLIVKNGENRQISIYDYLNIAGELEIEGDVTIGDYYDISFLPGAKLSCDVWNGNLNLYSPIEFNRDMTVNGNLTVNNTNSNSGNWILSNDLQINGSFYFYEQDVNLEITSEEINVTDYFYISSDNLIINSDIRSGGSLNIYTYGENCEITGSLFSDSYISINSQAQDSIINCDISSGGSLTINGKNVDITSDNIISKDTFSINAVSGIINPVNIIADKSVYFSLGTGSIIAENIKSGTGISLNSGELSANGKELIIDGNLNISSDGVIVMNKPTDYILISGNLTISSNKNLKEKLTDGTLELKGDFNQSSATTPYAYYASGTHKTVFSGDAVQSVSFSDYNSRFNVLEIKNTSDDGVIFKTDTFYGTLIDLNSRAHFTETVISPRTLSENEVINGNFVFSEGSLNLGGYSLTINGNLTHSGGVIEIGSGNLIINGDYLIEKPEEDGSISASDGKIIMNNEQGNLTINGNFVFNNVNNHYGYLSAGTISFGGNINLGTMSISNSGTLIVEIFGNEKQIVTGNGSNSIKNILFENTSEEGVEILLRIYAFGNLYCSENTVLIGSENIYVQNTASFSGSVWNGNINLYGLRKFPNVRISGDVYTNNYSIFNLDKDITIYGDLYINASGYQNSQNDHRLTVLGDVYGPLCMSDDGDYVLINGNYFFSQNSSLTNGVLEVKGDILPNNDEQSAVITASGSHKLILSGDKAQTLKLENANTKLNTVELRNFSNDGVIFTDNVIINNLIVNNCKITMPETSGTNIIESSITLVNDRTIEGDLYFNAGTINLNGFKLTILGDLIQSGGIMNINSGTLIIEGDYRLQSEKLDTYTSGSGRLQMINDSDSVIINGSFITESTQKSTLTAGTIMLSGDLRQIVGNTNNLSASGSHTYILNGTNEQFVNISNPKISQFYNLTVENKTNVTFETDVYVKGVFTDSSNILKDMSKLKISSGVFNAPVYYGNLSLDGDMGLGCDVLITGSLTIVSGSLNLNGYELTIGENLSLSSGTLTLNGDLTVNGNVYADTGNLIIGGYKMTVNGDFFHRTIQKNSYTYTSGYIKMTNPRDHLIINGNLSVNTKSNTQSNYTAGILEVKGDITVYTNTSGSAKNYYGLYGSGTHKTILSGNEKQTIKFDNTQSKFGILETVNTSEDGIVFDSPVYYTRIITNGNFVKFYDNGRTGWTLSENETIDGDLYLASGVLNLNGFTLTVNGSVYQSGGRINIGGGKLYINGDYSIKNNVLTGSTVSNGILSMINADDYVFVSGDFTTQSEYSHKYYLTAGTLEIGGDLIEKKGGSPYAFFPSGSHTVVLSGNNPQTVSFDDYSTSTVNSLKLKNTSESGVTFVNSLYITGNLSNEGSKLISSGNLNLTSTAKILETDWEYSITIADRADLADGYTLTSPLNIGGNLNIQTTSFFINEAPLSVRGSLSFYKGNAYINDELTVDNELYISAYSANAQTMTLNSDIQVKNRFEINSGIFNVNGHTVDVLGNLSIKQTGKLRMTKPTDRVNVEKDFVINTNNGTNGFFTDGVLDIKGDFINSAITSDSKSDFYAYGNHRTILSGHTVQNVTFDTTKSKFGIIEITNDSDEGVIFRNIINFDELITNDSKTTFSGGEREGWILESDEIIEDDLILVRGTLDLNGHSLTVRGNLIQPGGKVFINGGSLNVYKDYRIQRKMGDNYENSTGSLRMNNTKDSVFIGGGFFTQSTASTEGLLTAGTMRIYGDIGSAGYGSNINFSSSISHTIILCGWEEQNVRLPESSHINNLTITNTSEKGVKFENIIFVCGEFIDDAKKLQNTSNFSYTSTTIIKNNVWEYDFYAREDIILNNDLRVSGDFYLNGTLNLNGHTLYVQGNFINANGSLTVNSGQLYIDGNYSNKSNGGSLNMLNEGDYVLIRGNFYQSAYYSCGVLSEGILEIKGNFTHNRINGTNSKGDFISKDNHIIRMSGDEKQSIYINDQITNFNILEITKDLNTGYTFDRVYWNELRTATPDVIAPVVKSVKPSVRYIGLGKTATITASVSDDRSLDYVVFQISEDGKNWTDYRTESDVGRGIYSGSIAISSLNFADGICYIRVYAADLSGNISNPEDSPYDRVEIDTKAPDAPFDLAIDDSTSKISLSWSYSDEKYDIDHFRIYRKRTGGEFELYEDKYKDTEFTDENCVNTVLYTYKLQSVDMAGNISNFSEIITGRINTDKIQPEKPMLSTEMVSLTSIDLSWLSSDNTGVASYDLYKNDEFLINSVNTDYSDLNVKDDTVYSYYVIAYDSFGNASEKSDTLTIHTGVDDIVPEIINISAAIKSKEAGIDVNAADNYSIASITIDYSYNKITWNRIKAIEADGKTSAKAKATFDVSDLDDGKVYIRAVAEDAAGNISPTNESSTVEIFIDNTPPAKPENITVSDIGYTRGIIIGQPVDYDFDYYKIYRSVSGESFILYKDGYRYSDFYDTDTKPNVEYQYKITSVDTSQNESDFSDALTILTQADTNAPLIASVYPDIKSPDYEIDVNQSISLSLIDDFELDSINAVINKQNESTSQYIFGKHIGKSSSVVRFNIDTNSLTSGVYTVLVTVTDKSGNKTEKIISFTYTESTLAKPTFTVTGEGYKNVLSWTPSDDEKVIGYTIKRKIANTDVYQIIKQLSFDSSETVYYSDTDLTPGIPYSYILTAVDIYGHTADSDATVGIPTIDDDISPIADAGSDIYAIEGKSIQLDASSSSDNHSITEYYWDFGDGNTAGPLSLSKVSHTYMMSDNEKAFEEFTAKLTVYDEAGNSSTDIKKIKVYSSKYSFAEFTLKDTDTKLPLTGAYVYAGENGDDVYKTNSTGQVKIVVKNGESVFCFYKGEYLPVTESIMIDGAVSKTIYLKKSAILTGKMNVRELTTEEAAALGVDITLPENQHVYVYDVKVTMDTSNKDAVNVNLVVNGRGEIIPTSGYVRALNNPDEISREETNAEKFANFTKIADNVSGYSGDANVAIATIIPTGEGGTGGGGESQEDAVPIIALFRVETVFTWNKEFYNVDLTLMNNASTDFYIENAKAVLNVPLGLSLPDTGSDNDSIQNIGIIPGGESRTVSWILRGDTAGKYYPSADITGTLEPLGLAVKGMIKSSEPVLVNAGDAMELTTINEIHITDSKYQFEFMLKNVSNKDITGLKIEDIFTNYLSEEQMLGVATSKQLTLFDGTIIIFNDDGSTEMFLPALGVEFDYDELEKNRALITLKPDEYVIGRFIYDYSLIDKIDTDFG